MAKRQFVWLPLSAVGQGLIWALIFLSPRVEAQQGQPAQNAASGPHSATPKSAEAERGERSGLSVIVQVSSIAGDPVFYADGYRIRIAPSTIIKFTAPLKTAGDVKPGTWLRFEGALDSEGSLIASRADFYPPGTRTALLVMGPSKSRSVPDYQLVTEARLVDADGNLVGLHTKVRYGDSGGPCGWQKVPADALLQARVERVGMSVVPDYQKRLVADAPSRIPFRFYVVANNKVRSVFACNDGLVLAPKNVMERLKQDDQLAAVLAEAVSFHLQRQLVASAPLRLAVDAGVVGAIALPAGGFIAGEAVLTMLGYELQARFHQECARMALQLMANAGYDPWQAPEAWRLLAPKETPQDVQSLDYTKEGRFQLGVLKVQYKGIGSGGAAIANLR